MKETADAAGRVLASSIARIGSNAQDEPAASLLVRLARHEIAGGRLAEGRDHFRDYLGRMERSAARYSGDYGSYLRRQYLARVAHEYAKAGQLDDALDMLGQYADAPTAADYGDQSDLPATLTRTLRLLAAAVAGGPLSQAQGVDDPHRQPAFGPLAGQVRQRAAPPRAVRQTRGGRRPGRCRHPDRLDRDGPRAGPARGAGRGTQAPGRRQGRERRVAPGPGGPRPRGRRRRPVDDPGPAR